jgi:uncharacterized protein with HEPN domain
MRPESRAALGHILDAAREVQSVTAGKTLTDYEGEKYLRAIVERYFITIGEALNRLSRHDPDLFQAIPGARSIVGFRNVLVHGYDVVEEAQVWSAVTDDLEQLVASIRALLGE